MAINSICVTGEHNGRGFEVLANGTARWIPCGPFEYLLELLTRRFETAAGYLYTQDVLSTEGDEERTRQVVHRLREELDDYNLVENGRKSYRLACCANEIMIGAPFFEIPGGILDPRILDRIKRAMSQHVGDVTDI